MNANEIETQISTNVEDFYAGAVSFETFSARNAALWAQADAAGLRDQVNAIMRKSESK